MNIISRLFGNKHPKVYRIYEIRHMYVLRDGEWVKEKTEENPTQITSTDIITLYYQVPSPTQILGTACGIFISYRIKEEGAK